MLRRSQRAGDGLPPGGSGSNFHTQIRLFDPELIQRDDGCELSPRLKLRQFFERWFLPMILRKSRTATVRKYYDAIAWWETLTADPDIGDISDALCQAFADELVEAKYRRAAVRRGAAVQRSRQSGSGLYHTLSPISAAKHINRIACILGRAGPRFNPREPVAEIIERCPLVPRMSASFQTKPPFELEVARSIAAASRSFDRPDMPAWLTPPQYWQVQLAEYFYTGLRSGTVLSLQCKHFEDADGINALPMLNVPGDIVFKTSKAVKIAVHPQLAKILRQTTRGRDPDETILPEVCSYSHLLDLHGKLQRVAGLTADQVQSFHAWRRTHGNQMAMLGADDAMKVAQAALDHGDERTTRGSYVNEHFLNKLRIKLPELWPRLLFD
jgi:integrase